MKNLATCKPSEFVAQTVRIKDAVAHWVEVIDLINIRNTKPAYLTAPKNASAEKRAEIIKKNAELQREQALENVNKILDNMLAKYPQETLAVLALSCFVEPEHVDDHTMDEYLQCITEMMSNKSVMSFFSLLAQLNMQKNAI